MPIPGRALTAALAGVITATGCGTMHNMRQDGEPEVYGGVRSDLAFVRKHADDPHASE